MPLEQMLIPALPIACCVALGGLFLYALWSYFIRRPEVSHGVAVGPPPAPQAPTRLSSLLLRVLVLALASRLLIYAVALVGAWFKGEHMQLLEHPNWYFVRWDANHYIGLAKNWYVNEGDPRFHIVFYPLYPLLTRCLSPLTGGEMTAAALLASNLCLLGCGWALFRLVEESFDAAHARRALTFLMFSPLSLFFSLPYSESLFLLTTLLSVLMARRNRLWLAALFGALASATRLLGLVCAVPVFYEVIVRARFATRGRAGIVAYGLAMCCLVAAGFGAYLLLNHAVTGNPFQFLIHQREHWSQRFGSLLNTMHYTTRNMLSYDDPNARIGIWATQFAAIMLALSLMIATARRQKPGDLAYALVYFYCALAPTWLLSGARYLTAMYPLYPMLAVAATRRWQQAAVMALLILLTAYGSYMYAVVGSLF